MLALFSARISLASCVINLRNKEIPLALLLDVLTIRFSNLAAAYALLSVTVGRQICAVVVSDSLLCVADWIVAVFLRSSAYREPSFGHGILTVLNSTVAQWQWCASLLIP